MSYYETDAIIRTVMFNVWAVILLAVLVSLVGAVVFIGKNTHKALFKDKETTKIPQSPSKAGRQSSDEDALALLENLGINTADAAPLLAQRGYRPPAVIQYPSVTSQKPGIVHRFMSALFNLCGICFVVIVASGFSIYVIAMLMSV